MPEIRLIVPDPLDKTLDSLIRSGFGGTKAEIVRMAIIQMLSSLPASFTKGSNMDEGFSPEGRISQIEYAMEATKRGHLILGALAAGGVILAKRLPGFSGGGMGLWYGIAKNPSTQHREIRRITDSIRVCFAGLTGDAHFAIKSAIDTLGIKDDGDTADVYQIGEELASITHEHTLKKDCRVLGVNFLAGGLDAGGTPRLLQVDPSGSIFDLKIAGAGSGHDKALGMLTDAMDEGEPSFGAMITAVIAASLEGKADAGRLESVMIDVLEPKSTRFRELDLAEKKRYMTK